MTTLLIIIGVLLIALAFCIWLLWYLLNDKAPLYTQQECIDFAQSVTNHEVTVYDFEQFFKSEGKQVKFSEN